MLRQCIGLDGVRVVGFISYNLSGTASILYPSQKIETGFLFVDRYRHTVRITAKKQKNKEVYSNEHEQHPKSAFGDRNKN